MWYKKIYLVLFAIFIVISFVKGSCLEYGHSCWGAHGKRSGPPTANKIPSGNALYNYEDNINAETNDEASANSIYFENFDDLTATLDTSDPVTPPNEGYDSRKNSQTPTSIGYGMKHQQRHKKALGSRWRKFPHQNLHKNFIKSLLKNDFLQQLERKAIATKENTFYDIY